MSAEGRPFLQVIRGDATAEEVAALVAVLSARAAAAARSAAAPARRSGWADRSRMMRWPLPHGPGAWRAAVLPH